MRVVLVGAEFEQTLGLAAITAVTRGSGHDVRVVLFDDPGRVDEVARLTVSGPPDVIALSVHLQHRAAEFLALARCIRAHGYSRHLTAVGQFPTLAWEEVLRRRHGVDTVLLGDGDAAFLELLEALLRGAPVADVPGLAFIDDRGSPRKTARRRGASDAIGAADQTIKIVRHGALL